MTDYIEKYKKIFDGEKFLRNGKEVTHKEYPAFDGGGARTLIDNILKEMEHRRSITILDWGCGTAIQWHKQTLVNRTQSLMNVLGEKVQSFYRYDPAYEIYSEKPTTTYDFVICSDVLEHVPNENLENFFTEINSYIKKDGVIFYSISTVPSSNSFLDGENMHVNVKSPEEWYKLLRKYSSSKTCVVFNGKYKY